MAILLAKYYSKKKIVLDQYISNKYYTLLQKLNLFFHWNSYIFIVLVKSSKNRNNKIITIF